MTRPDQKTIARMRRQLRELKRRTSAQEDEISVLAGEVESVMVRCVLLERELGAERATAVMLRGDNARLRGQASSMTAERQAIGDAYQHGIDLWRNANP